MIAMFSESKHTGYITSTYIKAVVDITNRQINVHLIERMDCSIVSPHSDCVYADSDEHMYNNNSSTLESSVCLRPAMGCGRCPVCVCGDGRPRIHALVSQAPAVAADCDKPIKLKKFGWCVLLSYSALGEHALSSLLSQRPKGTHWMWLT